MSEPVRPEMRVTVTDRGLRHLPTIAGKHFATVRVYESSAADEPCIWLQTNDGNGTPITVIGLTESAGRLLAEHIAWLFDNHYQRTAGVLGSGQTGVHD